MTRDTGWFKSSYSSSGSGACVEVRIIGSVAVRDSKNREGGALCVPTDAWMAFIAGRATAPTELPVGRPR